MGQQQSQLCLLAMNSRDSQGRDLLGSGSLYCHFPWSIAKQIQSVLGENKVMSQSSLLRLLQGPLAGSHLGSA